MAPSNILFKNRSKKMENKRNYYNELRQVELPIKKKMGLNYSSWADSWDALKQHYPNANPKLYESPQGWPYWTDGKSCWVKIGLELEGVEHIEYYPVINLKNQAVSADNITSVDWNKAVQRATAKVIGRHGLGIYIYRGEDLPTIDIDLETANKAAEEALKETSQPEDLDKVRNAVIVSIQQLSGTSVEGMISDYITSQFNVRISQTTIEHLDKLLAAKAFLANLAKQAGINLKYND